VESVGESDDGKAKMEETSSCKKLYDGPKGHAKQESVEAALHSYEGSVERG